MSDEKYGYDVSNAKETLVFVICVPGQISYPAFSWNCLEAIDLTFISKGLVDVPCWNRADPFEVELWCKKLSELATNS